MLISHTLTWRNIYVFTDFEFYGQEMNHIMCNSVRFFVHNGWRKFWNFHLYSNKRSTIILSLWFVIRRLLETFHLCLLPFFTQCAKKIKKNSTRSKFKCKIWYSFFGRTNTHHVTPISSMTWEITCIFNRTDSSSFFTPLTDFFRLIGTFCKILG